MNVRQLLSVVVCLQLALTSTVRAQTNIVVCNDPSNQTMPQMIADGSGGAIITWFDGRSGAGQGRIYARKLNSAGTPQWTSNGVAVSVLSGNDTAPCIVSDGAGGAIIAWQHNTPSGILFVQRLDSFGSPQWPTAGPKNGIQITTSGSGIAPVITGDGAGGAIIVWHDTRGVSNTYDIYAAHVTSTGFLPWTGGGVAVCNAANDQDLPVVVSDAAGGAIMAWLDKRTGFDIYMERVNDKGLLQWGSGTGVLRGASTGSGDGPAITTDGAGGAIVTWSTDAVNFNVIAQRVDATGAAQWSGGTLVCTAANLQLHPQIVADGASGAFITWQDTRTNPSGDAYVQHVNAAGAAQWTTNGLGLTNANAEAPIVTSNGSGALVAWVDTRSTPADQHNLYARAISAAGNPGFPSDGTPVAVAGDDQIAPQIVYSGTNAFVTWQDRRSGGWDIYATLMNTATAVNDTPLLPAWTLGSNYPNPFLDRTRMNLDLPMQSNVKVDVFDVAGRHVRHDELGLVNAGRTQLVFDGRDHNGAALPSGVYFYKVHTAAGTLTRKMVITR